MLFPRRPPSTSRIPHRDQLLARPCLLWWVRHHLRLLLLEAVSYPLRPSHELLYTSGYATLLARDQRLGGEVINTVVEAAVDQARKHAPALQLVLPVLALKGTGVHEGLHLLHLHAALELALLRCCKSGLKVSQLS